MDNNKEYLVDLRDIDLLSSNNQLLNAKQFFEQIKNPYSFRVGDIAVNVEFGDQNSGSLQSHILNLLSNCEMNRA